MLHFGVVILRKMFSKKFRIAPLTLLLAINISSVVSLEPYQLYTEGNCAKFSAGEAENVDRLELEDMRFISSGSRYQLLRGASSHPRYETMREEEFLNSYCPQRNTTSLQRRSLASAYAFGRVSTTYDVRTPNPSEKSNIFVEAISRDPSQAWDMLRQTVAFTDNRNYAFLVNCWVGSDQASWTVISRTRTLSEEIRRFIRAHVRALKFNAENIVFLTNEDCQLWGETRRDSDNSNILRRLQARNLTTTTSTTTGAPREVQVPQQQRLPNRNNRLILNVREQPQQPPLQQERSRGSLTQTQSSVSYVNVSLGPSSRQTQLVTPDVNTNAKLSENGVPEGFGWRIKPKNKLLQ